MIREKEYRDECFNRFNNGGTLWIVERTDTNEFLSPNLEMSSANKLRSKPFVWAKKLTFMEAMVAYLTKEDAEKDLPFLLLREGGCVCCGAGSTPIPVEIREHEFVPTK